MVVESILSRPHVLESLRMGVVNYSALARLLKGEIEERLGRTVSESSVKMAIIRMAENLSEAGGGRHEVLYLFSRSTLTLIDDIGLVTFRSGELAQVINVISGLTPKPRFIQFTQGLTTVSIVADLETLDRLLGVVGRGRVEELYTDQSAIVIVSPREIIDTPGIISYISTILSFNGVNMTQIISAYTDTIIVVDNAQALRAYSILHQAIEESRRRTRER